MSRWDKINADSGEKTWLTPRHIVEALGHFDTDPCCPAAMPWRTADTMLTKADDGTTAPWHGRVWLNPPYGRDALPFLRRMAKHDGGGGACWFSRVPIQTRGSRTFSPSRIPCFSYAGAFVFVVRTERPEIARPRLRRSSRIPSATRKPSRTAASRGRSYFSNHEKGRGESVKIRIGYEVKKTARRHPQFMPEMIFQNVSVWRFPFKVAAIYRNGGRILSAHIVNRKDAR